MGETPKHERSSVPIPSAPPPQLTPEEIARREALNTLLQYDRMKELIDETLLKNAPFRLRPSTIQDLNRISIQGIESDAGRWRDVAMRIEQSQHNPPPPEDVPRYIDEMCEHVNDGWNAGSPLYLSAYIMWRLNWIHPFIDGNGRTTRAVSYYVLCTRLGFRIPGVKSIPELISENKRPYYQALEDADAGLENGRIDVSTMESLLKNLLAAQMAEAIERADSAGTALDRRAKQADREDNPRAASSQQSAHASFSLKLGAMFGITALAFFMALVILQMIGYKLPDTAKFLIVIVLAFSGALSTTYLGGNASARGTIPLPGAQRHPLRYALTGGIAVLIILLVLGRILFM